MHPRVSALASGFITSNFRRNLLHAKAEFIRRISGKSRELLYFHHVADPYSHLMVQVLPDLVKRFGLTLRPYVIQNIDPDMLPEPEMYWNYGVKDVPALADLYNLDFPENPKRSDEAAANAAGEYLAGIAHNAPDQFCSEALKIGDSYWRGSAAPDKVKNSDWAQPGERTLTGLGHYLPGMIWYGGEWYWGLDRLDHLERRLVKADAKANSVQFAKTYQNAFAPLEHLVSKDAPPLELFFSARSPYSYIGLFQARKFADAVGLELQLRPVLPMVMRNLKVPFQKRVYIITDTKREATKAGLPFGTIADPVGVGIERTYAIAHWVKNNYPKQLESFFRSATKGIMAEGIAVATEAGMSKITKRAGLDWTEARTALGNQEWREWVEENREVMTGLGLWGVPCLRFGEVSTWGQDRFWLIRKQLAALENV